MCYSAAPSTTNQNATRMIYIKDIKWLGKSLQAYSIKMQYENVIKGDRWCSCYTCLPQIVPAAQTAQKMAPGTPRLAQRLFTSAASNKSNTYRCMQTIAKDQKQYIIT